MNGVQMGRRCDLVLLRGLFASGTVPTVGVVNNAFPFQELLMILSMDVTFSCTTSFHSAGVAVFVPFGAEELGTLAGPTLFVAAGFSGPGLLP
mmetsp:Transcript_35111/g.48871  ORF Transcript_35111/g.48871 Transcript_35111/m.48871 type:complete len:93 (+) Transcript_35111:708-986(+)